MKKFSISLRSFTVLTLLGLSVWLKSPAVAGAVVLTLAIKEAREFLEQKQRVIELVEFEKQLEAHRDEVRQMRNEINQMAIRHSQTFGQ